MVEIPYFSSLSGRPRDTMLCINKTLEKWMKSCIFPFLKKDDYRITKNYSGIILITIVAKIYNAQLVSHIKLS